MICHRFFIETASSRPGNSSISAIDAYPAVDACNMVAYRIARDIKFMCDPLVAQPATYQSENSALTLRQIPQAG